MRPELYLEITHLNPNSNPISLPTLCHYCRFLFGFIQHSTGIVKDLLLCLELC